MFKHIKEEFAVIQERDPSIKSPMEVILYPSFKVMISYRRGRKIHPGDTISYDGKDIYVIG